MLNEQMTVVLKYRVVGLVLALVFGVFNVGVPVIVASCPMAAMMHGGRCGLCDNQDDPATAKVTTERNTSCCVATIVAERNTNEFVQDAARNHAPAAQPLSVLPVYAVVSLPFSTQGFIQVSTSPPAVTDIPIFDSSLLI